MLRYSNLTKIFLALSLNWKVFQLHLRGFFVSDSEFSGWQNGACTKLTSLQLHGLGSLSHWTVIGDCPHPYPIFFPSSSWYSTASLPCLGRSCWALRTFVLFALFIYPRAPFFYALSSEHTTNVLSFHPLQISLEGGRCAVSWVPFGCLSDWCRGQKLHVFHFPSSVVCQSQRVSTFSV